MEVSVENLKQFKADIPYYSVMSYFVFTVTSSIAWYGLGMNFWVTGMIMLAILAGVATIMMCFPTILKWLFYGMSKGVVVFIIKVINMMNLCYSKKSFTVKQEYQIGSKQESIEIFQVITPNIVDTAIDNVIKADDTLIIECLPELAVVQEQPIEQSKRLSNDVVFSTEVRRVDYFLQKQKELQQAREDVLYYTRFVWAPFLSDEDLKRLCEYTEMYIDNITVGKVPLLKIQGNLNYQDIFCWAWHVWKYLKKQNKSYNKNDLGNLLKSIFDLENWKDAKVIEKKLSRKNKGEFIKDTIGTCLENRDKKI